MYSFQLSNPTVDPLITLLCRNYSNIFDQFYEINEREICRWLKIDRNELDRQLRFLEERGIIDINWRTTDPLVTFLHERFPDDYLELRPETYHRRKERALYRMNAMRRYVTEETCRSQQLIGYFGQEIQPCGQCDVCKRQRLKENTLSLRNVVLEQLKTPSTLQEILQAFDETEYASVKGLLKILLTEEAISFSDGKYSLC